MFNCDQLYCWDYGVLNNQLFLALTYHIIQMFVLSNKLIFTDQFCLD